MYNKGKFVPKSKVNVFKQKRVAEEKEYLQYYPQKRPFRDFANSLKEIRKEVRGK